MGRSATRGMCGRPAVTPEPVSSMSSRSKYHLTLTGPPRERPGAERAVDGGSAGACFEWLTPGTASI